MGSALRTVVLVVICAVWAINFTAPLFVPTYHPAPEINVAFMGTVGVIIASYRGGGGSSGGK